MSDSIFAIQMNRSGAILQAAMSYHTWTRFNLMSEDFVEKSISTFPTVIKSPVLSDIDLWEEDTVPSESYGTNWVDIGERTDAFIVLHCDGTTIEKEEDRTGTSDHPFLTVDEAFTFIGTYLPLFCCVRNFRIVLHNTVDITLPYSIQDGNIFKKELYVVIEGTNGSTLHIVPLSDYNKAEFSSENSTVTFYNVNITHVVSQRPILRGCFCYGVTCSSMSELLLGDCIVAHSDLYSETGRGCIVVDSTIHNASIADSLYINCTVEIEEGSISNVIVIDCTISVNNSTGSPVFGCHAYRTIFNMAVHGKIYPYITWIYDSKIDVITTISSDTTAWGSAIFENGTVSLIGCILNGQLHHTGTGVWSNRRWGLYCSNGDGNQYLLKDTTINITADITPPTEQPDRCIIFCPLAGSGIIIRDCDIANTSQTTCPDVTSECISL